MSTIIFFIISVFSLCINSYHQYFSNDQFLTDNQKLTASINISKSALDGTDFQEIVIGQSAYFKITVTNTGSEDLDNVTVTDPLSPDCDQLIGSLTAGANFTYTCSIDNVFSDFTNVATVTGSPAGGDPDVMDTDATEVYTLTPGIVIEKSAIDGTDVQEVPEGGTASFEISVYNVGQILLSNVTVMDQLSPNCDLLIGTLNVGESFTYTCSIDNVIGDFTNVASVDGESLVFNVGTSDVDHTDVIVISDPNVLIEAEGGDVFTTNSKYGMIMKSPSGLCFRLRVEDSGNLTTEEVTCPQ